MNNLERGKLYRHKHCKDIQFYVVGEPESNLHEVCIRVGYWNPFYYTFQGGPELVIVKKKDFANWREVA